MKKNQHRYIILIAIVLLVIGSIFYLANSGKNSLAESKAVSMLKTAYPEFGSYPNDNLPPQSIRTEKGMNGWYVAFVQEGSGRPIIGAKCFFVSNDESIRAIGEFNPSIEDIDFSIKTCAAKPVNNQELTSDECVAKGGEVINTLNGEGPGKTCTSQEAFLGTVTGLRCPCICCRK